MPGWQPPTFNLPSITGGVSLPANNPGGTSFGQWFKNYNNKWGGQNYGLLNAGISAGADLAGNLINSNGLSTGVGNVMSGIGNIVGNIPGPIGWAGKALSLVGAGVNALWGHKFNDANVAAAESANRERNNWQFGDYSNTDALLAGSMANVQLGNVSKSFLGKEGPFSNAVTNKMKQINNDRMQANLRANNSELNAYNNYQTGMVRNAIAGDSMGNVNAAASGGPLSMISGLMTPFGNRYFANGGFTHGGLFTNGFVEVNSGGSHEQNPNQGVQYGVDPQGTPNMVEEGETILDDYVFSKRIKFPKRYKDEFALGGKIWKKSFADVSKMIAKESEERPNDPISQKSLKAMGGKLADIQEEVKAKQALDKMDPREVMAMLQQLAMMQQSGEQPQMQEEQMMADPYQQQMMAEKQPMVAANGGSIYIKPSKRGTFTAAATKHGMGVQEFASQVLSNPDNYSSAMVKKANFARNAAKWHACGGKLHGYGGNLYSNGGNVNLFLPGGYTNNPYDIMNLQQYIQDMINNINMLEKGRTTGKKKAITTTTPKEETIPSVNVQDYGFLKQMPDDLKQIASTLNFKDKQKTIQFIGNLLNQEAIDPRYAANIIDYVVNNKTFKEGVDNYKFLENLFRGDGSGYNRVVPKLKDGKPVLDSNKNPETETKKESWYGVDLYNTLKDIDDELTLPYGFQGKGLRNLKFTYNGDSSIDDLIEYANRYGSKEKGITDAVLKEYNNKKNKEIQDLTKEQKDIIYKLNQQDMIDDPKVKWSGDWDPEDTLNPYLSPYYLDSNYFSKNHPNYIQDYTNNNLNGYTDQEKLSLNYLMNDSLLNSSEYKDLYNKQIEKEQKEIANKDKQLYNDSYYNPSLLPTWMRYAPLAFSSIATLTDALGLTNKPDLTPYNQLIAQSDRMGKTPSVRYHPTFQPIQYEPINLNADLQQAANMYAAASRNVGNITGGNMGAGIAGNITALNQAGSNYGKLRSAIADADLKNRTGVAEFNNKGAYQDAMGSLQAQQINTNNIQNAQKFGYQALSDALKYYQAEQQAANAAKQVNLTHAVNSWANVGRENMYMNMINSNKAFDYWINNSGNTGYKGYFG